MLCYPLCVALILPKSIKDQRVYILTPNGDKPVSSHLNINTLCSKQRLRIVHRISYRLFTSYNIRFSELIYEKMYSAQ